MIERYLENQILSQTWFQGKVFVIYGPRQSGKTTLLKSLIQKQEQKTLYLSGDDSSVRELFSQNKLRQLKLSIGNCKVLALDEAQRIHNVGLSLKLISDEIPEVQVIATGSSSFDLANEIQEPLTGRKRVFYLYPFSFSELMHESSFLVEKENLSRRLVYGSYPEVITHPGEETDILSDTAESYLYKDILSFNTLKRPELLDKILQALALQIGSEVKYHELGQIIGADNETIKKYIELLEKAFVIFRLPALSRNPRNEIKKGRKIYFWDLGIRNYIIRQFQPLELRQDTGYLWENYLVLERLKKKQRNKSLALSYFWRSLSGTEVDYLEEENAQIKAWEFKWNDKKKVRHKSVFMKAYQVKDVLKVSPENYDEFIL